MPVILVDLLVQRGLTKTIRLNYFKNGWNTAKKVLWLTLFNFTFTIINFDEIAKIMRFYGFHFGVKFSFPTPIVTLWELTSTPQVTSVSSTFNVYFLILAFTIILFSSFVEGGYLGVLRDTILNEKQGFIHQAKKYFLRLFFYELLSFAVATLIASLMFVLWLLPFIVLVIVFYSIYATPFIIV